MFFCFLGFLFFPSAAFVILILILVPIVLSKYIRQWGQLFVHNLLRILDLSDPGHEHYTQKEVGVGLGTARPIHADTVSRSVV